MVAISYPFVIGIIILSLLTVRVMIWLRAKRIDFSREIRLLPAAICILVIARFTFFPFSKVDGMVQPLLFDPQNWYIFRINLIPFVHLFDYPEKQDALLNLLGNTLMFLPVGIVWPAVFPQLRTGRKALAAGVGFSFAIEILQLPFFDRVSDIDDLILNSLGFILGFGIWFFCQRHQKKT